MQLQIITPKEQVLDIAVQQVTVPGFLGSMGFLPGHRPLVSSLRVGELEYTEASGKEDYMLIHGGFVEVNNDVVTVLADAVELPGEIDLQEVEIGEKRAAELRAEARHEDAIREEELSVARKRLAERK